MAMRITRTTYRAKPSLKVSGWRSVEGNESNLGPWHVSSIILLLYIIDVDDVADVFLPSIVIILLLHLARGYAYPDGSVTLKTVLCCPDEGCTAEFEDFPGAESFNQVSSDVQTLHKKMSVDG